MRNFFLILFLLFATVFAEDLPIHYSSEGPNIVGHIYIGPHESHISQGTYIYVKKALEYYKEVRPSFIILELDTPGGEVYAAQKISDLLKEIDIQYGIPVIAYINNWAISAGALLAYSCRGIAVVKDGCMGAAEPVTQSGEKTSEKVNSAIRADFAGRASFYNRDPLIAEAMVDPDLTLVKREGKFVKLENGDLIQKEDSVVTVKGKLLTLNAKELIDLNVANILLLPEKLTPVTLKEKKEGKWSAQKELLFTHPFFQKIPNATILAYKTDWKTQFFAFLSSPIVASLLVLGLIACFYVEFSISSFGALGIVGLLCLFLLILSSFAIQTVGYLELIFIVAGILLILVEIFVMPGLWISGVIGALLLLVGLGTLLLPGIGKIDFDFDTGTLNAAGQYLLHRAFWLSSAIVVSALFMFTFGRFFAAKLRKISPLILRGEQEGYRAGLSKEDLPEVGSIGIVLAPLRTAGKVKIGNLTFDAVSGGKFIDKEAAVKVIQIFGSKIVVEEIMKN